MINVIYLKTKGTLFKTQNSIKRKIIGAEWSETRPNLGNVS